MTGTPVQNPSPDPSGELETAAEPLAGGRRAASERRRQRILDAARQCFGELGFARAKVETIAARAGVSNGLLYQFFRNKEHLFEVVIEAVLRDWRRAILPAVEERASAADAIAAMLRGSVEFAGRDPLLPGLLTEEAALELSRFSDLAGVWGRGHRDYAAALLRRGIAAGEFRADLDVEAAADVICQLQVDYSVRAYRPGQRERVTGPLLDAVTRFVLDALGAGAAAGPAPRTPRASSGILRPSDPGAQESD